MKWFGISAGAVILATALSGASEGEEGQTGKSPARPNFIIILADDLGYGDVGCYGNERIKTPNLDFLAREGKKFTDFHSNGAVCSPTRTALMTGRYQQRSGISAVVTARHHRHTGMALEETTIAEVLKEAGYATALFGKWHLGYKPDFGPRRQGFDVFHGFVSGNVDYHSHIDQAGYEDWWLDEKLEQDEGYTTDLITEYGIEFIKENKDRSFLVYLAHEAPHYPIQGRNDPPERGQEGAGAQQAKARSKATRLETYKEMIEVLDEGIGRVVQTVKEEGLEDDTFIFFFSDNGPATLGDAGRLRGKKGQVFEGGHRVPAVAYWPGKVEPAAVTGGTCMGMDLFPTMASLAGAAVPEDLELDGVDLSPLLLREEELAPRPLFWEYQGQSAMREGKWKFVAGKGTREPLLFDLESDVGEKNNLADRHPEIVENMKKELMDWLNDVRGKEMQPSP